MWHVDSLILFYSFCIAELEIHLQLYSELKFHIENNIESLSTLSIK